MTNSSPKSQYAEKRYVPGTSRGPRNARTFLLQMAADLERQREIGARIKELRGRRPQPVVAGAVGVTLRAYQAWEAGDSGIAWENLVKLADYFDVTAEFIEYGETGRGGSSTQLDRIENMLRRVLAILEEESDEEDELASGGAGDLGKPPGGGRSGGGSGKRSNGRKGATKAPAPRRRPAA